MLLSQSLSWSNIIRLPEVPSDRSHDESAGQLHVLVVKSGFIPMLLRARLPPVSPPPRPLPPPPRAQPAPTSGLASPHVGSLSHHAQNTHTLPSRAHFIQSAHHQHKTKKRKSKQPTTPPRPHRKTSQSLAFSNAVARNDHDSTHGAISGYGA